MELRSPALALLLLGACSTAVHADETCAPLDKPGVTALFDGWNLSLASLDPDAVAQRYWSDAVLLPTVSNLPRTSPAMIRDYFVHFLAQRPRGRIEGRTVQVGCNLATDVGTYTFSMMAGTGALSEVAARYTFVYGWRNGEWKIAHHHSSAMPEVPGAPPPPAPVARGSDAAAAGVAGGAGGAARPGTFGARTPPGPTARACSSTRTHRRT